jgi:phospholipid/cholesterol/gamma-HCH transport system substrate-binding protein
MTRSLSRTQAAIVGLLVLTGAAGAGYGLFAVGDRQRLWSGTFSVHVGFDRLNGVGVGTAVRVRGLEAGAVAAIDLSAAGRPDAPLVLRLDLDRRYSHLVFGDAVAQIRSEGMVGGKVIEIEPGSPARGPLADGAVIASKPAQDFNDVIDQAAALVDGVRKGEGSLGKLLRDDKVYHEVAGTLEQTKQLMQKSQDAVAAIQQDAEAIKRMPIVRGYVEDTDALLVRHSGSRHRTTYAAADLFETGRAVLTDSGKAKLDELGPWLTELRYAGSDVVVAGYADPRTPVSPQVAYTLTVRQAEAVAAYLKDQHDAHKLGWWKRREVKAVGLGTKSPPAPEAQPLPPNRVEVMVFVP